MGSEYCLPKANCFWPPGRIVVSNHNPNTAEATVDYILKTLIEANTPKVERAIQAACQGITEVGVEDENKDEECSAWRQSAFSAFRVFN